MLAFTTLRRARYGYWSDDCAVSAIVEIVGGPQDGRQVAVTSVLTPISVVIRDGGTSTNPRVIKLTPVLTTHGWRAYWPPTVAP